MEQPDETTAGPTYEITFQGRFGEGWSEWLEGLVDAHVTLEGNSQVTCLTVRVADQAALRGVLNRLWDLNLTLIGVRVMQTASAKESDHAG